MKRMLSLAVAAVLAVTWASPAIAVDDPAEETNVAAAVEEQVALQEEAAPLAEVAPLEEDAPPLAEEAPPIEPPANESSTSGAPAAVVAASVLELPAGSTAVPDQSSTPVDGEIVLATRSEDTKDEKTNSEEYWEGKYPGSSCYKYDPPGALNDHGYLTADKTGVILNPFKPEWPGDYWSVLIVKGGSAGDGFGNAVVENPTAGTPYYTPTNGGGQRPTVSHWIVCKGTSAQVTPVAPVFTPPTCDVPGTVVGVATEQYVWTRTGPDAAAVLTATAVGDVTLTGKVAYGPYDLTQLTGEQCEGENETVTPAEAVFTPPTCAAPGTVVGVATEQYTWVRSGPDTAAVLTAAAVGDVTLTGKVAYGPYDLTQLTGEECEQAGATFVPLAPSVTDQVIVCTADYQLVTTGGSITVAVIGGVEYLLGGAVVTGNIKVAPGTYMVAARPVGETSPTLDFTVTVNPGIAPACVRPVQNEPVLNVPTLPTGPTTVPTVVTPTPLAPAAVTPARALAATGFDGVQLMLAMGLLTLGGVLVVSARRLRGFTSR